MESTTQSFDFPNVLNATMPPERRGVRRDHVKLMVLDKKTGETKHSTFNHLKQFLQKGDLLVLNSSRTIPAILKASLWRKGLLLSDQLEVRLAHRQNEQEWEALLLESNAEMGDVLQFSALLSAEVAGSSITNPFNTLHFNLKGAALIEQIYLLGQPVRYEYIDVPWALDYYQTVFASDPGSVEMPSAGRAFSWELLFDLQRTGIQIAYIQLHTGLSYFMDDKWHQEPFHNYEQYNMPVETAELVRKTKAAGGRIIAVGTTVVRTLETAIDPAGGSVAQAGWTNLYVHDRFPLQIVDGLITGFHEPKTSHLQLLTAFVQQDLLMNGYHEAIEMGYYWHEFGDMNLII
ncbi:S-adenosylmethionine:tRNA ribosyltransferase-isomerase [Paenibacillus psychroresistens]|uniref:S-adenosylmethionine:tRNA ribosyltransferase-isomerase n=1 Tax=Paenibacillus psychroresistens TaxID=1778678 RepID=A0A6B8RLL9_9BACL|nr:S-adenosylmethionine:tRNA ribosyltransferase-isomerase [Paenibacillus psychroresistens]QGQ96316.1 S-adenosylmethionine:tRNA ribosyltransferase-isomerase [Paenibacillus psychroresistens]